MPSKLTLDEFINKSIEIHGQRYDYTTSEYRGSKIPIGIRCSVHGVFFQRPNDHLLGKGCPECGRKNQIEKRVMGREEFIRRAVEIHGSRYDYSRVLYKNAHTPVELVDTLTGDVFEQPPYRHLGGHHSVFERNRSLSNQFRRSREEFIEKAIEVHGTRFDYTNVQYEGSHREIILTCHQHGDFSVKAFHHLAGVGCQRCSRRYEGGELELCEYLSVLGIPYQRNVRSIIAPKELDLYLPDHGLAIEYCGLYWHREEKLGDSKYHWSKFKSCEDQGISLITLFEDEWKRSRTICETILRTRLGKNNVSIGARCLDIRRVAWSDAKQFYQTHHIQGSCQPAVVSYGGFRGDELVGVMSFGHPVRQNSAEYELKRFCSGKNRSPGLASRLFKLFLTEYNPRSVVSFSDNRWYNGDMYRRLGFVLDQELPPDYTYTKDFQVREHKSGYRKSRIQSRFDLDMSAMTEREAMHSLGYHRIWDCGKRRWLWTHSSSGRGSPVSGSTSYISIRSARASSSESNGPDHSVWSM